MLKKTSILMVLSVIAAAMFFISCGSKSSSGNNGKAPDVEVVSVGTATGGEGIIDSENTGGNTGTLIVIQAEDGSLPVNGESLTPASYSNQGAVTVTDEHNGVIVSSIDTAGNIIITPADGSAAGTYTVVITADSREYILIIAVDASGTAAVNTAISYPAGSNMVLDLDAGKVKTDIDRDGTLDDFLTLSSINGSNTGYTVDSSISSFTVKDADGNSVTAPIDPVTGDLITSGGGSASYVITIIKTDGTIVTINTDSTGKITSIPVEGMSHVLIAVQNGTAVIVAPTAISGVSIEALISVSSVTASGVWNRLSSITGMTAFTGENYSQEITVKIDPVKGSIVTPGLIFTDTKVILNETTLNSTAVYTILINAEGKITSYIKVEIKSDGTSITTIILFDENGKIKVYEEKVIKPNGETTTTTVVVNADGTSTVTAVNVGVMLRVESGSVSSNGFVLSLTDKTSGLWTLKNGVEIISGMAADGSIPIDSLKISIDPVTGYLLINGDGTIVPAGPYEIKVLINGSVYIIKSDENGNIENIIPGSILLQTAQGFMTYCDRDVLKISGKTDGTWSISSQLGSLTAADSNGNSVNLSIDPYNGNIVTTGVITGPVTITFIYTDSAQNQITYTVVVINGSVSSYSAEITNPGPDFDFSTVTNIKIYLNVVNNKTGLPLGQASINLLKAAGDTGTDGNWKGFTDSSGVSIFAATVENAGKTNEILVSKTGFETFRCPVDGIGKLIEYARKIALNPVEAVVITDRDGDGVADEDDAYPNDPSGAKSITGVYTLAFEDLYPSKGDSDFNDLVATLTITEKIDSQNMLRRIDFGTKLLAAGAGYKNILAVNVNNTRYVLIENPKSILGTETYYDSRHRLQTRDRYNSRVGEVYLDTAEIPLTIEFTAGISRETVGAMPYDPFIICNGVDDNQHEVHLPFVKTSYKGIVLDADKFPWGLLVPDNWGWPYEAGKINDAYPEFQTWYMNDGTVNTGWYSNPDSRYVYRK